MGVQLEVMRPFLRRALSHGVKRFVLSRENAQSRLEPSLPAEITGSLICVGPASPVPYECIQPNQRSAKRLP
jgi:hypothetical protein